MREGRWDNEKGGEGEGGGLSCHRPHFLYGTHEFLSNLTPIKLPYLDSSYYDRYMPLDGVGLDLEALAEPVVLVSDGDNGAGAGAGGGKDVLPVISSDISDTPTSASTGHKYEHESVQQIVQLQLMPLLMKNGYEKVGYEGSFNEAGQMNGQGTYYFTGGNRYTGGWVRGKREGFGR